MDQSPTGIDEGIIFKQVEKRGRAEGDYDATEFGHPPEARQGYPYFQGCRAQRPNRPGFPKFLFQFQCSSLPAECVAARRPYVIVRRMKAQRRFVSGPCIARLLARHRMSVNVAMRAGRYGRLFHVGRIVYVDLTEVERAEGLEVPAYNFDTGESRNEVEQIVAKARADLPGCWLIPIADVRWVWVH